MPAYSMPARARTPAAVALVAAFVALATPPAMAQDVVRMDQVVRSYADAKTFMGSVLVARDGKVLFNRSYGSANLEWSVPNTPTTRFRIGSITKQFTAASILLLAERGKLSLDDPVRKHMPGAPAAWDAVTLHHLLTHTSGIPSFTGFPEYMTLKLSPSPIDRTIALFRDRPLEFAPGERMNYSNSGYVLLGYLVEKISGQSYASFVRDNIFTPLGMESSDYDMNSPVVPQRAAGYAPGAGGPVNAAFIDMSIPHGAGALASTTEDLLRWTQGLFGGKLLSAASLEKMTTPFKNDYALGVLVLEQNGRKLITHSGGIEGFNSYLAYYPADKVTIVSLANLNGPAADQIGRQLGAVVHGLPVTLPTERKEVTLAAEVLAAYTGTYPVAPTFVLTVSVENGGLVARAAGQPPVPLHAEAKDRFFTKIIDAQVEFTRGADGRVDGLILRQNGNEMRARRQ
jgi:CubicO group peptidase (beta-lactamase class C family)